MQSSRDEEPQARADAGLRGRLRRFWGVPTYRFAVNFLAYLAVIGLCFPWVRRELGFLFTAAEDGTARIVFGIASLFGGNAKLLTDSPTVFLDGFPVTIIEECTGLYEALLLGAALLAYPTSWRNTLLGFAVGYPLIYLLNVLRILMLLAIGRWYPPAFDFTHIYFWQVTMILTVVFVLYVWVRWVVRTEVAREP
jgi:exosortase H (IPTLxxWG-CTERM-specific)